MSFLSFSSFLKKFVFQHFKNQLKIYYLSLLLVFQLKKPANKQKQTNPQSLAWLWSSRLGYLSTRPHSTYIKSCVGFERLSMSQSPTLSQVRHPTPILKRIPPSRIYQR
jgi:hypothetical protein